MSAILIASRGRFISRCGVSSQGALAVSRRSFHQTNVSQDFFSWIKDKKKDKKKTKSTKEVISEIESGKDVGVKTENVTTLELTPENFIGTFDKKKNIIPLNTVPFNHWMASEKTTHEETLNTILVSSFNEVFGTSITDVKDSEFDAPFNDIIKKFSFCKLLQSRTGYLLSDYQFTILNTPSSLKEYYLNEFISGKTLRRKESEPDAIYLDQNSFKAPNIRVIEDVSVREQKQKLSNIINEVNAMEDMATKEAIEKARET